MRKNSAAKTEPARRGIPSVEKVLQSLPESRLPRPVILAVVRRELAKLRVANAEIPPPDTILEQINRSLAALERSRIQPVINGTGILIHTNLGRSPLGSTVVAAIQAAAANYNNLEFDLASGARGKRASYLEHNLALLCGAEAATVANNCAAALVLILRHFTSGKRKEVIISRGELIQIGGGFRIPDILAASGATLREVGTTNRTSLRDYERAINSGTALLLKVHLSNFYMGGFVEFPPTADLAALARRKKLPFVEDLGSGAVVATEQFSGVDHEPTPAEVIKQGADLVCFSGDKLLGGPQAGIIAGQAKHVNALKQEPFFRALRCDKLILSALQSVVDQYLAQPTGGTTPVLKMLETPLDDLRLRAGQLVTQLAGLPVKATVGKGKGQIGGGTLPKTELESVTLDLIPKQLPLAEFAARLRQGPLPVIGYVAGGRFKLDLRTVFPEQDNPLLTALRNAL